jgi:hypothetical protein
MKEREKKEYQVFDIGNTLVQRERERMRDRQLQFYRSILLLSTVYGWDI